MNPPAVSIAGISKRYRLKRRNVVALDDVTLSIAPGECVAIAGVNGAGKTTLLRCLLDFAQPDAGEIRVFGIDSRRTEARRAIAFLPERFLPSPYLTGAETLAMMAGLQDQRWPRDRIDRALGELEFPAEALERRMREYSKGMTQKLGLASAILQDKPLMVLDEPMSGPPSSWPSWRVLRPASSGAGTSTSMLRSSAVSRTPVIVLWVSSRRWRRVSSSTAQSPTEVPPSGEPRSSQVPPS
jgi:ABC-type multidrug transport system ATPase subunit